MKKIITVLTPLMIITLMISTVTAVPHFQGKQAMTIIDELEQRKSVIEDQYGELIEKIEQYLNHELPPPTGIIEFLIQLILLLINIVEAIIQFVLDLLELGVLLEYLIGRILFLIDLITQFIEWLLGLFNPYGITSVTY